MGIQNKYALFGLLLLFFIVSMGGVEAHTKWFVPFDIKTAPMPIDKVLTKTFVYSFLIAIALIYSFFLFDRTIYKKNYFSYLDDKLKTFDSFSLYLIRFFSGLFFVSLWIYYQITGNTFFITSELKTKQVFIPWLQLLIGLFALSSYTTPLIGVGFIFLYAEAVYYYGIFHLLDYLLFLGIAYFLIVSNCKRKSWKTSGFVVLYALTGISLLWVAMEKLVFPFWSYELLAQRPNLTMGLPNYNFILIAGFIEFSLIFVLLSSTSIVGRFVAFGLEIVFILAIIPFGIIDALGHTMIIAILLVLILRGPTEARDILALNEKSVFVEAYFMTALYVLSLAMFFIAYYGLHYLIYNN